MKRLTSLLFGFALALPGVALADAPTTMTFPDVPEGHWAGDAVKRLAEQGIIEGKPNGKFEGNVTVTRYEFAVVIARLLNSAPCTLQAPPNPAPEPKPTIASAIRRRVWRESRPYPPFADMSQTHWAIPAVQKVSDAGIMEGVRWNRFNGKAALKHDEFSLVAERLFAPVEYVDAPAEAREAAR
ncbi:S-layer homology domain-containing protein [bacterium]|nr:MAG: S-layer homology domain-containing protein [bacterium]